MIYKGEKDYLDVMSSDLVAPERDRGKLRLCADRSSAGRGTTDEGTAGTGGRLYDGSC
jgi:hypothetical protein